MRDIIDVVRAMAVTPATWSRGRGLRIALALGSGLDGSADWDKQAGEDWAQVGVGPVVIALVGMRWPVE